MFLNKQRKQKQIKNSPMQTEIVLSGQTSFHIEVARSLLYSFRRDVSFAFFSFRRLLATLTVTLSLAMTLKIRSLPKLSE